MNFLSAISRLTIILFAIIEALSYSLRLSKVCITHICHRRSALHTFYFLRKTIFHTCPSATSTSETFLHKITSLFPAFLHFLKIWFCYNSLMCIFMDNPLTWVGMMLWHIPVLCSFPFSIYSRANI